MKRGALVVCIIIMSLAVSGCTWISDLLDPHRITRQYDLDSSEETRGYWLYEYDTNDYLATVLYYDSSDALVSTTTYAYTDGERTRADTTYESGGTSNSSLYSYTSAGVLEKTSFYSGSTLTGYNTYEFDDGKKTTTYRYTAAGASNGRSDFSYGSDGLRTTTRVYDASSALTTTGTRTYTDGLMTRVIFAGIYAGYYRAFEWESGRDKTDRDVYFEF